MRTSVSAGTVVNFNHDAFARLAAVGTTDECLPQRGQSLGKRSANDQGAAEGARFFSGPSTAPRPSAASAVMCRLAVDRSGRSGQP